MMINFQNTSEISVKYIRIFVLGVRNFYTVSSEGKRLKFHAIRNKDKHLENKDTLKKKQPYQRRWLTQTK